ncbi:DctP family TRAP transporter solute-binding subunit [Lachnoclostridium edouardi]|uniref:DctP family TRAP transporter solute-binding subunit n=2 Tax=Lachnoclostridium edouardi TaxID=1926283 RepID=UPI000C797C82|nr:DctP family TRAP transporter solute-binding subunit [Lachnoclostridium edouardi]
MKKLKKFAALGLTAAMVASLAACGGKTSDAGSDSGSGEENIKLSLFAGSIPENTPTGGALKVMADYINENSNGTLTATAFYDTALGDATSMVQGLQQGTVDIGVSGTAYFSGLVPEVEVFQLPFLFSNLEEARAACEGPAKDAIFEKLAENGIIGLSFWENGFRELSNNIRPVKTPDDMKGMKMRTLSAEVQVETWKAMGALPAAIDASELFTALQQGTVSAQDNPLHEIVSRKLYEVQPYVTLTDAVYTPFLMGMSEATWNKLSDSQKEVIMKAAEVGREEQLKLTDEAQAEALQTLLDNGVTVEENPDKEAFKEKAVPTWSLFTDQCGTEILDLIQSNLGAGADTADTEEAAAEEDAAVEDTEEAAEDAGAEAAEEAEDTEAAADDAAETEAESVEDAAETEAAE